MEINVQICTFYIIGCLYYYWSLTRINPKRIRCLKWTDFKCFYMIAEFVLISSIIINITIFLILFFKLKQFHLFNIFIIYIFFVIDHDAGLVKHGIYNILGFIFLSFSFVLFCYIYFVNLIFFFSYIFIFQHA